MPDPTSETMNPKASMQTTRTASPEENREDLHTPERPPLPQSHVAAAGRDEELCHRVLAVSTSLTECTSRPPTYREVLASLGLSSHRRLSACLDDLVRTGHLQRVSGSRTMIVTDEPSSAALTP